MPAADARPALDARALGAYLRGLGVKSATLMEVCGTHTAVIARAGLKRLLPPGVRLVSGPGCPVCVTPAPDVDAILALASRPGVCVATYGDMLKVPGTKKGDTLAKRRALGADVRVVYSAADAAALAAENPDREVVFLGVGFETTAPGTACAVLDGVRQDLKNFTVFSLLKRVTPALRALIASKDFAVNGFLCPGHVATIIGSDAFAFLAETYRLPAVVAGFEPDDVAGAVARLLTQIARGQARCENAYVRAVRPGGNPTAMAFMDRVFTPAPSFWRGLGAIPDGGLMLRPEFARFDAAKRFGVAPGAEDAPGACRCGDVVRGAIEPKDCPLFGTACTPEDPEGPCMVSSEGSCAAAYKYGNLL